MNPYSSICDDFGIYAYVNTKMELPSGRETVLHFFNSLQKTFPMMTDFDCRGGNEYVLEEDRDGPPTLGFCFRLVVHGGDPPWSWCKICNEEPKEPKFAFRVKINSREIRLDSEGNEPYP